LKSQDIVRINRIADGTLLALVDQLEEILGTCKVTLQLPGGVFIDLQKFKENFEVHQSHDIVILTIQPDKNISSVNVNFYRGASKLDFDQQGRPYLEREPSIYFDEFQFSTSQSNPQATELAAEHLLECLSIIDQHTTRAPAAKNGDEGDFTNAVQQEVAELRELYREMVRDGKKREQNQDETFGQKQRELEAEHQTKLLELKQRQDGLDEREKSLDDRSHMHVRRELREQITNDLKERAAGSIISKRSRFSRMLTYILPLSICGIAVFFAVENYKMLGAVIESGKLGWELWVSAAKAALPSFLCVATGLTVLAWMRRDHLNDVRQERELVRLSHDIDRATWVIEIIMEMTSDKEGKIPDAWIEGACRNLFDSGASRHQPREGNDALEKLFNMAGSAEIGPDGVKWTVDKKALRAEGKKMSAANDKDAA